MIHASSVKNPVETGSLANTVIWKSTGLFKPGFNLSTCIVSRYSEKSVKFTKVTENI